MDTNVTLNKVRPYNWWWPDAVSWARAVLVLASLPFLWMAMTSGVYSGVAAVMLIVTYVTDFVDGKLARAIYVSFFGAMLDTTIDKFAVIMPIVFIVVTGNVAQNATIGWTITVIIITRELIVFAGRPLAKKYFDVDLSVDAGGKFKMAVQCTAIVAATWMSTRGEISEVLFAGAAAVSLSSLYVYWHTFRVALKERAVNAAA